MVSPAALKRRDEDAKYFALLSAAVAAGLVAGAADQPDPMTVVNSDGRRYHVPDGPCGFAWVIVRGDCAFGRWLRRTGRTEDVYKDGRLARPAEWGKSHAGGYMYWVGDFGQSMSRKEACAHAMARVLQEAGVRAIAGSRMD